jgi:hypothetical protein
MSKYKTVLDCTERNKNRTKRYQKEFYCNWNWVLFPPVFAAVANALYKATGKRYYDQPFGRDITQAKPTKMEAIKVESQEKAAIKSGFLK